jgi:hypothetical protein
MKPENLDPKMYALILFAYDTPPLNNEPQFTIDADDLHIDAAHTLVQLEMNGIRHTFVGIKPSGWAMVTGIGWCLIDGLDDIKLQAVSRACNQVQSHLLKNREGFLEALQYYMAKQEA